MTSPNPYEPTIFTPLTRTSWLRLFVCVTTMLSTTVVFLYFLFVSLVYCYMLLFPQPGWPIDQVVSNIVIWAAFAVSAAFGFFLAVRFLKTPLKSVK